MKVLLSMLLFVLLSFDVKCENPTDSLLNVLKSEILKKNIYDNGKIRRIRKLKQTLDTVNQSNLSLQYALCDKLYLEYKDFNFDSAHVYTRKLLRLSNLMHNQPKKHESQIKLGAIQLSWGMFKETFDGLSQINIRKLPDSVKLRYYELKSQAFINIALYNTDQFYSPSNKAESLRALDSALYYTKPGSYERLRHTAELLNFKGKPRQAAAHYTELLRKKELSYHQRAMIAHDLSQLMKGKERIRLITLSAIYDIRSSTKETLAIFTLGNILFEQGEIEEAELLLQEALHQAQFYGNILHKMEIQAIITTVSAQKLIISESKKNTALTIMIIFLAIAITGTAIVSFIVFTRLKNVRLKEIVVQKKNQHLDKINKKLLEDASIKEEYIGYFFNVISGYILKLEKIKRNTERKIKIKNYDELLQIANEIDIKHERNTLFYTFDSIFLKLFPNFIETFNSLLKPEDQIWPKGHEVLNTNLRIFALMRLGIKDNQTIANILESTVSTIYTYKIRVKSKAFVQGDDFENRIMEIKFVDLDN
jgi:tetratricopeptide (TPR) repeat protein